MSSSSSPCGSGKRDAGGVRASACPVSWRHTWTGLRTGLRPSGARRPPGAPFRLLGSIPLQAFSGFLQARPQARAGSVCLWARIGSGQLPQERFVLEDIGTDRTCFPGRLALKPDTCTRRAPALSARAWRAPAPREDFTQIKERRDALPPGPG